MLKLGLIEVEVPVNVLQPGEQREETGMEAVERGQGCKGPEELGGNGGRAGFRRVSHANDLYCT